MWNSILARVRQKREKKNRDFFRSLLLSKGTNPPPFFQYFKQFFQTFVWVRANTEEKYTYVSIPKRRKMYSKIDKKISTPAFVRGTSVSLSVFSLPAGVNLLLWPIFVNRTEGIPRKIYHTDTRPLCYHSHHCHFRRNYQNDRCRDAHFPRPIVLSIRVHLFDLFDDATVESVKSNYSSEKKWTEGNIKKGACSTRDVQTLKKKLNKRKKANGNCSRRGTGEDSREILAHCSLRLMDDKKERKTGVCPLVREL